MVDKLLAWVKPQGGEYLASFVGGAATQRAPATRLFGSPDKARRWVEEEAAQFGAQVEWLSGAPET